MSRIAIAASVAALLAGSGVAEAQFAVAARDVPPGHRPPPGMCRVWIDGVPPGRQPPVTDCFTARARAGLNSRIIYGDLTPFPGQGRGRGERDCRYEERRSTLGDIIFGRRAADRDVNCRFDTRRQLGAWYEIGRDSRGVPVFQRIVRLQNGTALLQRGYLADGRTMRLFDTRYPRVGTDLLRGDDDFRWASAAVRGSQDARRVNAPRARAAGSEARGRGAANRGKGKGQVATGRGKGPRR